ncbi:Uncharacterised protein [Bordetella pertussis]|nr:Uncharacterised protein [Bordetella pertussis]
MVAPPKVVWLPAPSEELPPMFDTPVKVTGALPPSSTMSPAVLKPLCWPDWLPFTMAVVSSITRPAHWAPLWTSTMVSAEDSREPSAARFSMLPAAYEPLFSVSVTCPSSPPATRRTSSSRPSLRVRLEPAPTTMDC